MLLVLVLSVGATLVTVATRGWVRTRTWASAVASLGAAVAAMAYGSYGAPTTGGFATHVQHVKNTSDTTGLLVVAAVVALLVWAICFTWDYKTNRMYTPK